MGKRLLANRDSFPRKDQVSPVLVPTLDALLDMRYDDLRHILNYPLDTVRISSENIPHVFSPGERKYSKRAIEVEITRYDYLSRSFWTLLERLEYHRLRIYQCLCKVIQCELLKLININCYGVSL